MNKIVLSIISLFAGCLYCYGQHKYKTIDADRFERRIASKGVQLLDVRTSKEFTEGHIASEGVMNVDVQQADFISKADHLLDKNKVVAVYCRSGKRSADAAELLGSYGYKVIDLKGGILEWQARGKKTTK